MPPSTMVPRLGLPPSGMILKIRSLSPLRSLPMASRSFLFRYSLALAPRVSSPPYAKNSSVSRFSSSVAFSNFLKMVPPATFLAFFTPNISGLLWPSPLKIMAAICRFMARMAMPWIFS